MTDFTGPEILAIVIQVVIVLVIARRSIAMTKGVPYSGVWLAVLPIFILVLWGVYELTAVLQIPWALPYLIAADLAILIATSIAFAPVAERMTTVTRRSDGTWIYQIGASLAIVFVTVFVVRLVISIVLFPGALQLGPPPNGYPPLEQQVVLAVIDALFSFSTGLLIARSIGIRRKVQASGFGLTPGQPPTRAES